MSIKHTKIWSISTFQLWLNAFSMTHICNKVILVITGKSWIVMELFSSCKHTIRAPLANLGLWDYREKIWVSVQGTVGLWSYILPIDRYPHTL